MTDADAKPAYTPNRIALGTRIFYFVLSAALLIYGGIGLWLDDIWIPGKRTGGAHLHGPAAWAMAAALAMGALNMLSVVVDHFDTRNNETNYRLFGKITAWAGFGLFGLALVLYVVNGLAAQPA